MGKRGQRPIGRSRRRRGRLAAALAVTVVCALWATPALAADPYPAGDKPPPQVLAQNFFNGDSPAVFQGPAAQGGNASQPLAFTGLDALILVAAALAALAIGFVLWRAARQRATPSNR